MHTISLVASDFHILSNMLKTNIFESANKILTERFGEPLSMEETRVRISPQEVITTWEDLYREEGIVSLEALASWLATTEEAVVAALPSYLTVNDEGDVVENNVAEAKKRGPSKAAAKSWVKGTKKFKDKVKKAKSAGMENPEGFAAWMTHKATGAWPSAK